VLLVGDVERHAQVRQQRLLLPRQRPGRVQRLHRRPVRLQLQGVHVHGLVVAVVVFVLLFHPGRARARGHGVVSGEPGGAHVAVETAQAVHAAAGHRALGLVSADLPRTVQVAVGHGAVEVRTWDHVS
jgi:hypothetical protein